MRVVVSDIFSSQPFEDFSLNEVPLLGGSLCGSLRTDYLCPPFSKNKPFAIRGKTKHLKGTKHET